MLQRREENCRKDAEWKSQRWDGAEEGSGGGAVEVGDKIEERMCNFIGERDPAVVSL